MFLPLKKLTKTRKPHTCVGVIVSRMFLTVSMASCGEAVLLFSLWLMIGFRVLDWLRVRCWSDSLPNFKRAFSETWSTASLVFCSPDLSYCITQKLTHCSRWQVTLLRITCTVFLKLNGTFRTSERKEFSIHKYSLPIVKTKLLLGCYLITWHQQIITAFCTTIAMLVLKPLFCCYSTKNRFLDIHVLFTHGRCLWFWIINFAGELLLDQS